MNCVNCHSILFLFNETEELYPGSEQLFCTSCRKKITPFLEDQNTFASNAEHLESWKKSLEKSGVTEKGLGALSAYCQYLDRITNKSSTTLQTSQPQTTIQQPTIVQNIQVVPLKEVNSIVSSTNGKVDEFISKMEKKMRILKWFLFSSIFGTLVSIIAFIVALMK